jgi:hypothetical protein
MNSFTKRPDAPSLLTVVVKFFSASLNAENTALSNTNYLVLYLKGFNENPRRHVLLESVDQRYDFPKYIDQPK